MNYKILQSLTIALSFVVSALPSQASQNTTLQFKCTSENNIPVTILEVSQSGKSEVRNILTWLNEYFPDKNVAEDNCQMVAQKLQNLYSQGKIQNISLIAGIVGDIPVVCLESETKDECTADQVLFTLENTEKPGAALNKMISENLRDQNPLRTRGDFPTKLKFNWLQPFF